MPHFSLPESDLEDEENKIEEEEPAHPIGFGSPWGRTWISLEPPPIFSPGQATYVFDLSDDEDEDLFSRRQQTYPSLSSYVNAKTVSTKVLLQYREPCDDDESSNEDQSWLFPLQRRIPGTEDIRITPDGQPLPRWSETSMVIEQKMQAERKRCKKERIKNNTEIHDLIKDLQRNAALISKDRKDQEDARREKLEGRRLREEAAAKQEANDRKEKAALASKEKAELIATESVNKKKAAEHSAAAKKASQLPEYAVKGSKLVAQLVDLRKSIEPFEKSKAVSKRRLQMKKSIRGKVNTLSEDARKVQEVAMEVSQAITAAREEDAQIKHRLEKKEPGITSEMVRGKRYMIDLLASNIMQRIQAESFNGPRGDGFPLAAMAAMISLENKEFVPILAAHVYTVCPIAIPTFPKLASGASEDDFMLSLGMAKDKNGEFESWSRFSTRTENIIAVVANIMASSPSTHILFGGHQGASDWLTRFLDLLPPPPTSPLPLLTAPVLHAFLSGAGNMLANKHSTSFGKNLERIVSDIVNRLDDGETGKPSSIRLSKLLEGGFDGFRSVLPPKAIPELYYGQGAGRASSERGNVVDRSSGGGESSQFGFANSTSAPKSSPFGSSPSISNPFGGTGTTGLVHQQSTSASDSSLSKPFGSNNLGNNPFGGGSINQNQTTSFQSNPSPFGKTSMDAVAGSSSPKGGTLGSQSRFTSNTQAPASSFHGHSNGFGASGTSNFGGSVPNASPFGGTSSGFNSSHRQNPSPFGVPSGINTMSSSFGGNRGTTNQSPFTNPTSFSGASSFGGGGRGSNNGQPASNSSKKKAPCKYFAKGNCRFGSNCRFSHDGPSGGSGFGGNRGGTFGNNNNSGFGDSRGGGSFGNKNAGFGGSNPFGGGGFSSNQKNPFG
eukprot:scaffold6374_cov121-Cylindrotheca_fusiformis.AAC.2